MTSYFTLIGHSYERRKVKTCFWLILVCLPLFPLPSCRVIKTPEFKYFKQLKITQLGLTESTLNARLVYFNPNKFGYKISNFAVDIYINGELLGRSTSNLKIEVAKMASFDIPVELKVNMKNLPVNSWNLLTRNKVFITAKGFVMVGMKGIYKEVPVKYEGEQEIKLF